METIKKQIEKIYLSKKSSGCLIVGQFTRENWEMVAECSSPKELLNACKIQGYKPIILKEYSISQLKSMACVVTQKQALQIFNIPATKENIKLFFND